MRKKLPSLFSTETGFSILFNRRHFSPFRDCVSAAQFGRDLDFQFQKISFQCQKNETLSSRRKIWICLKKWNCQQHSRLTLIFSSRKVDCRLFPCNFVWPTMSPGFSGLDCNRPLEKSDPYELRSDFGCYLPLFDNLYFRPKTILSFCLASPPSNACQKSEIFQIWKCLKYIRLSFCPIQNVPKLVFKPVQGVPHKDRYVKIN